MPTSKPRFHVSLFAGLLLAVLLASACGGNAGQANVAAVGSLHDTPAVRLNFRYEGDVPAPTIDAPKSSDQERNASVQSDFDTNRPQEFVQAGIPRQASFTSR